MSAKHGPAGRRLVREVLAQLTEDGLEPDVRERHLLDLAAGLADRLAEVQDVLAVDGITTTTAAGGIKPHPMLAAERQLALGIQRLLDGVSLTAAPVKSAAKVRAAQTRWRAHNAAKDAS